MCFAAVSRSQGAKKVFTLVELLVVIAIISILASMLLPALERARDAALSAKCMNNEKGIGTAINMYLSDSDDTMPGACYYPVSLVDSFETSNAGWRSLPYYLPKAGVAPSLEEQREFWTCPSHTDAEELLAISGLADPWKEHYTTFSTVDKFRVSSRVLGMLANRHWNHVAPMKGSQIATRFAGGASVARIIGDASRVLSALPSSYPDTDPLHMNGFGLNMLYADGHVEAMLAIDYLDSMDYDSVEGRK